MTRTLEVIILAQDQASAQFKTISKNMEVLTYGAQQAAMGFGAIAAAGTALIAKTTLTAARTEELGVVIDNLGKVAGYSKEELDAHEKGIKDLGITTQGARTIMSRFMGAELDLADASKIARAAQDLAVIAMQDSSEAAENLTYAIASMQPRILRQYGLFLNLNDVYKQVAQALGKDVQELTEAEKRQGMLNAVIDQAGNFAGTYESAMTTAGKQLRSFRRYTEEISNEFGANYLPAFGEAIGMATRFAKSILGASDASKQAAANIVLITTASSSAMAGLTGLMVAATKLMPAMGFLFGPAGLAVLGAGALTALATSALQSEASFKANKKALLELSKTQREYVEGVKELIPQTEKATVSARSYHYDAMKAAEATAALAAAWEFSITKAEEMDRALRQEQDEYIAAAEAAYKFEEAVVEAATEAEMNITISLGRTMLDLRDNIAAYEELESTVTTVYANTTDIVDNFNDWREQQQKGLQDRLLELEEKRQEKIAWVLAGAHARTQEENDEALAYWNARYDKERDKLIHTVNEKIAYREEEKNEDIARAQEAAAERSRLAEEERLAEMERLRTAQEERILLFGLEMLAYKDQLKVPIEGWEDMKISADDFLALTEAGIIPLTDDLKEDLGGALTELGDTFEETGGTGEESMEDLRDVIQDAIGDVMDMGTETDNLEETTDEAHGDMRKHIKRTIQRMERYCGSVREAIRLTKELARVESGVGLGAGTEPFGSGPGLQAGLTYVPARMPAILDEGEAVLTRRQAADWRAGISRQTNVYVYAGGVYGMDGAEELIDQMIRETGRYVI